MSFWILFSTINVALLCIARYKVSYVSGVGPEIIGPWDMCHNLVWGMTFNMIPGGNGERLMNAFKHKIFFPALSFSLLRYCIIGYQNRCVDKL